MEPLAMMECDLDTCKRGPPLIKLIGYEHRIDAVGCGGSRQWQSHTNTHTHTVSLVIHRMDGASFKDQTPS